MNSMTRREWLKNTGLAGGGLLLAVGCGKSETLTSVDVNQPGEFIPNAFLRVAPSGDITVIAKHDEMGQGIHTSIAMTIADEMEADWTKVNVVPAPADPAYNHSAFGMQITGGSSSTWSSFEQMRTAGAAAREMLQNAAAARWGVAPDRCRAENGFVAEVGGSRKLSFGELASDAAKQPVPAPPTLKAPKDWRLIGKAIPRVDSPTKVKGTAIFSMDTTAPNLLVAVVARSPSFGGTVKSFDGAKAKAMAGVVDVVPIPSGVAVIAKSTWQAIEARAALSIEWQAGPGKDLSTEGLRAEYTNLLSKPGLVARKNGEFDQAFDASAKKIEATYEVPFQAHAPMEPLSCMVTLRPDGGADLHVGSQSLGGDRTAAASILGCKPEQVAIRNTFLGGGFGRRANPHSDFVSEAVHVAKAAAKHKAPIKTVWTREDDLRGGYYRPMFMNAMAAGLDADGDIVAWRHRIAGQSITAGTAFESFMVKDGIDSTSVEGAADMTYALSNVSVELHTTKSPITTQWWRSVGHSNTAFAKECFLDEVALAAGKDPFELRRQLLKDQPRSLRVLEVVAKAAGWGSKLPEGVARGIAVHESFKGYAAHVAEVTMGPNRRLRVQRVVCAIECGQVINPDIVKAQMESAVAFGLSATLHSQITLQNGQVAQTNFDGFAILRMNEMPRVEVHIVPSTDEMGGIGEVSVPPVAPAVCNAIAALTGKRIRQLPIGNQLT